MPLAIASFHHARLPAAESMQPKTHQAPSTAWHIVCRRPPGSASKRSACAKTTPEVPSVAEARPVVTMPMPIAPAAWSPAPPTTGVPAAMPSERAALALSTPVVECESSAHAGSRSASRSSFAISFLCQRRFFTWYSPVPEASLGSAISSLVSR